MWVSNGFVFDENGFIFFPIETDNCDWRGWRRIHDSMKIWFERETKLEKCWSKLFIFGSIFSQSLS